MGTQYFLDKADLTPLAPSLQGNGRNYLPSPCRRGAGGEVNRQVLNGEWGVTSTTLSNRRSRDFQKKQNIQEPKAINLSILNFSVFSASGVVCAARTLR